VGQMHHAGIQLHREAADVLEHLVEASAWRGP
jgi:hypothetical protein